LPSNFCALVKVAPMARAMPAIPRYATVHNPTLGLIGLLIANLSSKQRKLQCRIDIHDFPPTFSLAPQWSPFFSNSRIATAWICHCVWPLGFLFLF